MLSAPNTPANWLFPLVQDKVIEIDSSQDLISNIKKRQRTRRQQGYSGSEKSPVAVKKFAKPKLARMRPLDLLHAIGRITTPIMPNLVDLSATWAIYRYVWAFSQSSPRLSLSQTATEIDFHQKGLLSDEIGIGTAYWLMVNYFGVTTPPIDVDVALRNERAARVIGIPPVAQAGGQSSMPDYIFALPGGEYAVIECKGTQSSRSSALDQIRRGLEQVPSIIFPGRRKAREFVISTLITDKQTEVRIVDPPENSKDVQNQFIVRNQRQFDDLIRRFQAANILSYAGAEGRAANVAGFNVGTDHFRQEPPEMIHVGQVNTTFRGYSFTFPFRGQIGPQISVFCGVADDIFEYIISGSFAEFDSPSYWPAPAYWHGLLGIVGEEARGFISAVPDSQESIASFSRDGTILQITIS